MSKMVLVALMLMATSAMAGWDVQITPDGDGGMEAGLAFRVQFDQAGVPADLDLENAPVTVNSVGPSTNVTDKASWLAENWVWVAVPVAAAGGYALVAANNDYWPYTKKDDDKKSAATVEQKPTVYLDGQNNFNINSGGNVTIVINNGEGNPSVTTTTGDSEVAGGNP